MEINFIRHGMTAGNLEKRYIGRNDEPLCSEGLAALKAKNYPAPGVLICSPMKRCVQTAEVIFTGVEPLIYSGLRECDFGDFEGKNYLELSGNPAYQRWIDSNGTAAFPGGESPDDFRERCCAEFLRAVNEHNTVEKMTFIVHGGTIMSVMERFSVPKRSYYDWHCDNGCGFTVNYDSQSMMLISEIK